MAPDVNEELVGAYLSEVKGCRLVVYDVRFPGGGVEGLSDLDVVGLDLENHRAYLCEVMIRLNGLILRDERSYRRLNEKHARQVRYAKGHLKDFPEPEYMFWSPRVREGIRRRLERMTGLTLIVNEEFSKRVDELVAIAGRDAHPTGNSAFRTLQVLAHLKR
jgi:hypothetical protein